MAVAVKNASETTESSLFDRLAVRSLLGALYLLVSFGLVFYALPAVWRTVLSPQLAALGTFVDVALMLLALAAAAGGCIWLGLRLVGPSPTTGLKGGICCGLVLLALVALLTWGIGALLDSWFGDWGIELAGQLLVAGIGLALLALAGLWYLKPAREDFFVRIEEQGWFSSSQYKKSQGLKVRRSTMVGILVLIGCGIYTMTAHQILPRGPWLVAVPFTGMVDVRSAGDSVALQDWLKQYGATYWFPRQEFEAAREEVRKNWVRVRTAGDSDFEEGKPVPKAQFDSVVKELERAKERPPTSTSAQEPSGSVVYAWHVWLLPNTQFTVPLILVVAALWLSFRVVNFPPFADFLIATEAELNKVSWTTRKRLVQDTIVVLVTVILLTVFLLVVDLAWGWLLTKTRVLPEQKARQQLSDKEQPW